MARTILAGALAENLKATIATRIAMPPRCTKAPASNGAPPFPLAPLGPPLAPSIPPQPSTWPPNMWDLVAELMEVACTTIKIEVQATMTRMHTTSTHRPHGDVIDEGLNSKFMKSTPSEILRAPIVQTQEPFIDQVTPDRTPHHHIPHQSPYYSKKSMVTYLSHTPHLSNYRTPPL